MMEGGYPNMFKKNCLLPPSEELAARVGYIINSSTKKYKPIFSLWCLFS